MLKMGCRNVRRNHMRRYILKRMGRSACLPRGPTRCGLLLHWTAAAEEGSSQRDSLLQLNMRAGAIFAVHFLSAVLD